MAKNKIVLTYFDLTGRAEITRLILTWADVEFVDNRISRDKWPELKGNSPFGQLPYAEINGKAYGQSLAIANFCAREYNLYGKTNLDGLKIDQIAQLTEDLIQEVVKGFREPDDAKKAEIEKKVKEEVAPKFFGFYEKLLKENNGEHFVGDSVTLADLIVYDVITGFVSSYTGPVSSSFPLIKALAEKIGSNDRIKAYKAKHS